MLRTTESMLLVFSLRVHPGPETPTAWSRQALECSIAQCPSSYYPLKELRKLMAQPRYSFKERLGHTNVLCIGLRAVRDRSPQLATRRILLHTFHFHRLIVIPATGASVEQLFSAS